jgi:hypothetical protein
MRTDIVEINDFANDIDLSTLVEIRSDRMMRLHGTGEN